MPKRANDAKNLSELTEEEKRNIIKKYYEGDMTVRELGELFNLTRRTLPALFKEKGIKSKRKNRYTLNEKYFHECNTERKAYWLGYLYADGFVGDEHFNNIVFVQKESNGYVIEQFAKDICFTGTLRTTQSSGGFKGKKQKVINFSSKTMANDLKKLKMETCKSMTMTELPPITSELIPHFIRGYFDGDGCVSRNVRHRHANGKINYSHHVNIIGTEIFLKKIAELLPCESKIKNSHTPEMKYLCIQKNKCMEPMFHYLYDDASFYLVKKYNIWLQILGDLGVKMPEEKRDKPDKGCPAA